MRIAVTLTVLVLLLGLATAKKNKLKNARQINKRQDGACSDVEFQCKNGDCIQSEWTCDSDDDCGDNSDETLPECPPSGECTGPHEILCGDGKCQPIEFRCDGDDDCDDGTDEKGCEDFECTDGEFHCANNLCVEGDWKCDGDNDCGDMSDEQGCSATTSP